MPLPPLSLHNPSSLNSLNLKSPLSPASPRSTNSKTKTPAWVQTQNPTSIRSPSQYPTSRSSSPRILTSCHPMKFARASKVKTIADLKQSLDDVTSLVTPKKKFSFKNKLSKKSANLVLDNAVSEKNLNAGSEDLGFEHLSMSPGFRDKEKEVLVKEFDKSDMHGQNGEFTLSGLSDCEVRLKGRLRALFIDRLTNCRIYVGAVMGSVLIEGVEGCFFVLASHQIKVHDAKYCDFYLRVRSRPIIKDCNGVRFAPYCVNYEGIEKDLEEANLGDETGNWANVDDFRWLRAVQSPNWSVLPDNERTQTVDISNSREMD